MTRQQVYEEIEGMFGLVPTFIKTIPDATLEMEWSLMKRVQFDEGHRPMRAEPGAAPRPGHGVPLIANAPGVEPERKRGGELRRERGRHR